MVQIQTLSALHELAYRQFHSWHLKLFGPIETCILYDCSVNESAYDICGIWVYMQQLICCIWAQVYGFLVQLLRHLQHIVFIRLQYPMLIPHYLQLLLEKTFHIAQVNSWWIFHMFECLHNQLYLACQRFVLFFIHSVLKHCIDQNWHPCFESFNASLLCLQFCLFYAIQINFALLLCFPLKLFVQFHLVLFSPLPMPLSPHLWIFHRCKHFLYSFFLFFTSRFLTLCVFFISNKILHSILKHVFHS